MHLYAGDRAEEGRQGGEFVDIGDGDETLGPAAMHDLHVAVGKVDVDVVLAEVAVLPAPALQIDLDLADAVADRDRSSRQAWPDRSRRSAPARAGSGSRAPPGCSFSSCTSPPPISEIGRSPESASSRADVLHARVAGSRRDLRAACVDRRPLPGRLDAGELAELGDQADVAEIFVEHRAGEIAKVFRRFRAGDVFGRRHRQRARRRFRTGRYRDRCGRWRDRAPNSATAPDKSMSRRARSSGLVDAHQRLDLGDMVELRRQAVDARNLELGEQRLGLGLGAGVADPDRLEVADLVDRADRRQRRVGGLRPRVGLAGLEEARSASATTALSSAAWRGGTAEEKPERQAARLALTGVRASSTSWRFADGHHPHTSAIMEMTWWSV